MNTRLPVLFLLLVNGSACGGGQAEPSEPSAVQDISTLPPAPDLTIQILVENGGYGKLGDPVRRSLTESMMAAGYRVRESTTPPPDLVLKIRLDAEAIRKTVWNGMSGGYRVKAKVQVVTYRASEAIDQTSTEFTAKEGQTDDNALRRIVVHLAETKRLSAYADRLRSEAADEEEASWTGAGVDECRTAASKSACKGTKAYLERFPSGKHAEEARSALAENVVAEEENAWRNAGTERCMKPTASRDCASVERYLAAYPTGKYVTEANSALKTSEKARATLMKQEEAKQKAEDREDCVKACRRKYEAYTSYEAVVSRCVQNQCN